jgi:hypothetical protein
MSNYVHFLLKFGKNLQKNILVEKSSAKTAKELLTNQLLVMPSYSASYWRRSR